MKKQKDDTLKIDLGSLPEWDLSDFYSNIDSSQIKKDLSSAERKARVFNSEYKEQLSLISDLRKVIEEYEGIDELLCKILSYAQLVYAGNICDPEIAKFYQSIQERVNDISGELLFFTLEINQIDENILKKQVQSDTTKKYEPWLSDLQRFRSYQLGEESERLIHDKQVSGSGAWCRLFDETMASLRFDFDGKSLTSEEIMNKLSDPDSRVRKCASENLGRELSKHSKVFSLITNTLAKDKEIEDRWRKFPRPDSFRNLSNKVEDSVVNALNLAVRRSYKDLSHRYYKLKAQWFGKSTLDHWDRNAPLLEADSTLITWEKAKETVLAAYRDFSPVLADIGERFFEEDWIDATVREGKSSGAFSHPTVPSVHPYILLNYQGRLRDVMTLAHELGHGCHQLLAAPQGHLMADTPLTLAETASVFGEMLTFKKLLDQQDTSLKRKIMLSSKVEDMLNTVIRQIAFFNFELKIHEARRSGELTAENICDIWVEVQSESLGPSIRFDHYYRWFWTYIPHFIHSPFYVYAYAFGDCLVNSLYSVYEKSPEGFVDKYLDMLRSGGSKHHTELLSPFGLNASDSEFWQIGLNVIGGMIDELETMS